MSNERKKTGSIRLDQARALDARWDDFVASLDENEAGWLIDHFRHAAWFALRRPDDGILARTFHGSFVVQDFVPRIGALDAAGLLKYKASDYRNRGSGDVIPELFPGAPDGPKKVRVEMQAYAMGDASYREEMRNVPTGLPRVTVDLRARGFTLANFHQAASFAAWWNADEERRGEWARKFGPCRLYALGTIFRDRSHERGIVPVFLSPGARDGMHEREDATGRWRLDYEHFDRSDRYRESDAWFLTVTPA